MDDKGKAHILEQVYVHDVYDRLSSMTLQNDTQAWPNVRKFLNQLSSQNGDVLVADIGCGTGKYVSLKSDMLFVACDRSIQLCQTGKKSHSEVPFVAADNLHLPFRNNLFDAVLSIGVIHHLANHTRRVQAIQECLRILKPNGGQLLIYAWAIEQKQRKFCSQDVLVPCINSAKRADIGNDKKHWPSSGSIHIDELLLRRRIEQDQQTSNNSSRTVALTMVESIQNFVQRVVKHSAPSSPSIPSKSSRNEQEQPFRIRPFPMSSCCDEQPHTDDLNPLNKRFYHVFKRGELEMLIEEAARIIDGSRIIKSYYDHGNWCAIVRKDL